MTDKTERMTFRTPLGRLSFPWLIAAQPPMEEGGTAAYSTTLILPKDADLTELNRMIEKVIKEKWAKRPSKLTLPIRDGAEKAHIGGYGPDVVFLSAKTQHKPIIVGPDKAAIDPEAAYAGCYVKLSVTPFAYDKGVNRGVALALNAVQFVKDGEPFASSIDVDSEFDDETSDSGSSW